jgi:class 3 adenylate cyclase
MRSLLADLWNLRRSPRRIVRLTWWGALLALLGLIAAPRPTGMVLMAGWVAANLLFGLRVAGWGLFHLRTLLKARDTCLRWAAWLTLLSLLALFSVTETNMMEQAGFSLPASIAFFVTLGVSPLLFMLMLLCSVFGAAIGAFLRRAHPDREVAAHSGVSAWWLAVFVVQLAAFALYALPGSLADLVVLLSAPLLAAGFAALLRRPGWEPRQIAQRLVDGLARRLVWRREVQGRTRTIDQRGAALGLLGALLALVAAQANLLVPMQASTLVSLIRLRNTLRVWQDRMIRAETAAPRLSGRGAAPAIVPVRGAKRTPPTPYRQIVLLEMDAADRYDALMRRSEVAVQADLIRKLSAWRAARIVMPLPALTTGLPLDAAGFRDAPAPTPETVLRSLRDLPQLLAAMRRAGNVALAIPERPAAVNEAVFGPDAVPEEARRACVTQLMQAAKETGRVDLPPFGSAQLPTIPMRWEATGHPPVPLLLAAAMQGRALEAVPVRDGSGQVQSVDWRAPRIAPGRVLVNFRSTEPDRDFPRLTYASVLREAPIYVAPPDSAPEMSARGYWLPPRDYIRDKIVFLVAMTPSMRETPIGMMPQSEALANATATLLAQTYIARSPPPIFLLATLLLVALVGHLCTRCAPLRASWRVALAALLVVAGCLWSFLRYDIWTDPVTLLVAIGLSALFVTQFTFALEQHSRSVLRRFVPAQVVEELTAEKLRLGGTRRQVCVLFADVRRFTRFAEQNTPELVIEIINRYMTALTNALDAHDGLLDKYTGDGLMALFRVQDAHPEEDIARAVCAALAMRDTAEEVSARLAQEGLPTLQIGFSLHCGEAVVGLVGNPDIQVDYTALGITVVVSARLQSLAAGGEVIVSEAVYAALSGRLRAEAGEPVNVKGLSTPVRPYRVLSLTP